MNAINENTLESGVFDGDLNFDLSDYIAIMDKMDSPSEALGISRSGAIAIGAASGVALTTLIALRWFAYDLNDIVVTNLVGLSLAGIINGSLGASIGADLYDSYLNEYYNTQDRTIQFIKKNIDDKANDVIDDNYVIDDQNVVADNVHENVIEYNAGDVVEDAISDNTKLNTVDIELSIVISI